MIALQDLAKTLEASLFIPDGSRLSGGAQVKGVAPIAAAREGDITFLANPAYAHHAETTLATAVITAKVIEKCKQPQLIHPNPYWAFATVAQRFFKDEHGPVGVSPLAYIHASAKIADGVTVMPYAFVGEKAEIAEHAVLYPGVYVGRGAKVGKHSVLRANVVIEHGVKIGERVLVHAGAVVGADGFGFATGAGGHAKIPQIGGAVVGDDVELGALVSVARGAMDNTVVGKGSKLDSHVHVGHGAKLGQHCLLCGLSGVAGSATIGDWLILGGHSGIKDHCKVGDRVTVGSMTSVYQDIEESGVYMGTPSQPAGEWKRQTVAMQKLPDLLKRVRALEDRLAKLEGNAT